MNPTITVFEQSPDGGKGLSRDMRVRWAFEEVCQPYDVRLVSFSSMKESEHRALHPFGQIPTYQEGDLALFESGAIVLRIAETHTGLLPADSNGRSRAIMWIFAALNTVETPILDLIVAKFVEGSQPWAEARLALVRARIHDRLGELSRSLGDSEWLEETFSAGDLMMISVMTRLRASGILNSHSNLSDYVARGEARPAYRRAFAAQLEAFNRWQGS